MIALIIARLVRCCCDTVHTSMSTRLLSSTMATICQFRGVSTLGVTALDSTEDAAVGAVAGADVGAAVGAALGAVAGVVWGSVAGSWRATVGAALGANVIGVGRGATGSWANV